MIDKSSVPPPPYIPHGLFRIETAFELDDSIIVGMVLIVRSEHDLKSTKKIAIFW